MELTNCLSASAGRRHDTREATTMTTEQLFNRKFLKKTSMQPYVNTRMFLLGTDQTLIETLIQNYMQKSAPPQSAFNPYGRVWTP